MGYLECKLDWNVIRQINGRKKVNFEVLKPEFQMEFVGESP